MDLTAESCSPQEATVNCSLWHPLLSPACTAFSHSAPDNIQRGRAQALFCCAGEQCLCSTGLADHQGHLHPALDVQDWGVCLIRVAHCLTSLLAARLAPQPGGSGLQACNVSQRVRCTQLVYQYRAKHHSQGWAELAIGCFGKQPLTSCVAAPQV